MPDPEIVQQDDVIVKVTATAICGSDLHLYNGYVTTMEKGDILGHEFMGEVVEVGTDVHERSQLGDRVVVPFPIACGRCWYCRSELSRCCDNSNPNAEMRRGAVRLLAGAGIFGYSHMYGGYAGGQAEYVRVPFADVGPIKVPDGLSDEQVLFLSDILPTGWQAARARATSSRATRWPCGAAGRSGYFTIQSAFAAGRGARDRHRPVPGAARARARRLRGRGRELRGDRGPVELLKQMTGGRGPDVCIDAVGLEAHGTTSSRAPTR